MSIATWPPGLPTALEINGLSEVPIDQWIENNVSMGSPKRRLRFTGEMATLSGKMTFNPTQIATFLTFFRTTLKAGSLPFQWTRPSTGETVQMLFLSSSPAPSALGPSVWKYDFKVRIDPL